MEPIYKAVVTALIAYSSHYGVVKLYDHLCVPDGIRGFITGIFTTGSPICSMGVNMISGTQVTYSSMLLTTVTRLVVDLISPLTSGKSSID